MHQCLVSKGQAASSRQRGIQLYCHLAVIISGDHLSGKPGNVGEFDSCQGNIREKILSGNSCLKLLIVCCIFASIQVFNRSLFG